VIRRRDHGRNHSYVNEAGEKVPQVSDIAKKGVDKSGPLSAWASRITADYVLDHWDELAELPLSARYWKIRGVANRARNEAQVKGTRFHTVIDRLSAGMLVEYDPAMEEDVQAGLRFLRDFDASPVLSEATVWSERFGYAGTFDTIQELATGPMTEPGILYETWLLDYKRANDVYPENALQAEGYAGADWLMSTGPDGELVATSMPVVDHIGIVLINAELPGGYQLIPVPDDKRAELSMYFRHAQHMAHFAEIGRDFLGDPIEPPVWADSEDSR
jgi:hypothetical protein